MGGRGANSGIAKLTNRKDQIKEILKKGNVEKSNNIKNLNITSSEAHRNKEQLVNFVKQQTGVTLSNDKTDVLNKKRKSLYTQISRTDYNKVASLLNKNGFHIEGHVKDSYWIHL